MAYINAKEITFRKTLSILQELRKEIREDQRKIAAWYKLHPTIPYEIRNSI